VTFQPRAHNITLANVKRRQVIVVADVPDENVDAWLRKIRPLFNLRPICAGKNNAETGPIHPINDAQPFGIAVGDKDADGKGIGQVIWPRVEVAR
jgi:hypothetical protein